jgi:predicted AAA+ superfamily ATPase
VAARRPARCRYLDALRDALVVRTLLPWSENLGKRQVKTPKVYLSDTGLLHTLLQLRTRDDLLAHPKVGASWEGAMLQQAITWLGAAPEETFFWGTHAGAEPTCWWCAVAAASASRSS